MKRSRFQRAGGFVVYFDRQSDSTADEDGLSSLPLLGGGSTPRDRLPRRSPPSSGSVRRLMRSLEARVDLLIGRGVSISPLELAQPYARLLARLAWTLAPAAADEKGYDARGRDGSRYRIVGLRTRESVGRVEVPGVPDRFFDRIVLVRLGVGFDVKGAWMAEVEPFLKSADYDEPTNRWSLGADDAFWSGGEAKDVTRDLRRAASRIERKEEDPSSASTPRPRRPRASGEGGRRAGLGARRERDSVGSAEPSVSPAP